MVRRTVDIKDRTDEGRDEGRERRREGQKQEELGKLIYGLLEEWRNKWMDTDRRREC